MNPRHSQKVSLLLCTLSRSVVKALGPLSSTLLLRALTRQTGFLLKNPSPPPFPRLRFLQGPWLCASCLQLSGNPRSWTKPRTQTVQLAPGDPPCSVHRWVRLLGFHCPRTLPEFSLVLRRLGSEVLLPVSLIQSLGVSLRGGFLEQYLAFHTGNKSPHSVPLQPY